MKQTDVVLGGLYYAKVSGRVVVVRMDSTCPYGGGWWATNMKTKRRIRIRTARRLRGRLDAQPGTNTRQRLANLAIAAQAFLA